MSWLSDWLLGVSWTQSAVSTDRKLSFSIITCGLCFKLFLWMPCCTSHADSKKKPHVTMETISFKWKCCHFPMRRSTHILCAAVCQFISVYMTERKWWPIICCRLISPTVFAPRPLIPSVYHTRTDLFSFLTIGVQILRRTDHVQKHAILLSPYVVSVSWARVSVSIQSLPGLITVWVKGCTAQTCAENIKCIVYYNVCK